MKKSLTLILLIPALVFTAASCKKAIRELFTPKEELPQATQEGKNTFGFLLNGEIWIPKGGLLRSKLDLSYDPNYNGGALSISAKRFLSENSQEFLSIGGAPISGLGTYNFRSNTNDISYYNVKTGCDYTRVLNSSGSITITRFDLNAKIISGTFNFKLEKDGCPNINATDGRFDMRIE